MKIIFRSLSRWVGVVVLLAAGTAGADAPPGRYTVTADTVVDNYTQLTWQRVFSPTTLSWDDAVQYCVSSNVGGFTDWRLPSVKELTTLIDPNMLGTGLAAIDGSAFPLTPAEGFWSSTVYGSNDPFDPGFDSTYFLVDFDGGQSTWYVGNQEVHPENRVRCVRP